MAKILSSRALDLLGVTIFPALVTIQAATAASDSYGGQTLTWSDLAGHVGLAGRLSPVGERERRTLGPVVETAEWVCALQGQYSTVTPAHRAVVDSAAYDITGVRADGDGVVTYLGLRRVTT